ncbi:hypothetical protein KDW_39490 [Dictyobacter vulcani]|uniref:Uncharacterized protein n=1 Tax=Dictyobacter vulcani TaxID=2607529 RepID=A0A5J4KTN2_9CHLR|nr:hypothetical protein [Dictyobacter vulcani]GER89787.1 hypothetical protein KDW_39490 [Dictyobacter vulcani]
MPIPWLEVGDITFKQGWGNSDSQICELLAGCLCYVHGEQFTFNYYELDLLFALKRLAHVRYYLMNLLIYIAPGFMPVGPG